MKTSSVLLHPTALLCRPELHGKDALRTLTETDSVKYANTQLGYKHPEKLKVRAASELSEAFRITGIKPFDPQTVRDYKARCILEKQGKGTGTLTGSVAKFIADDEYKWKGFDTLAMVVSTIAMVAGFGTTVAGIITGFSLAWPISMLICGATLLPLAYKVRIQSRKWKWRSSKIEEYTGEIPQFALDTAKEIHMRATETRFFIEELVEVSTQRVVDPFLVACDAVDGSSHHLEVWEEPTFDQTRRV